MNWTDCRIVAFDTETTGLQSYNDDRIVEFGAVELFVNSELQVERVVHHPFLIFPERAIPREASSVSGIYDKDVADKPVFKDVAEEIWAVLDDAILIAHNFNFDFGFIRNEFRRLENGKEWPRTRGEIDTLTLARLYMKELKSKRLNSVAKELRVPLENAHRAVDDAEATGRVFVEMVKRFQAPLDLDELLEWAVAVGHPPKNNHIALLDKGVPEFISGEHKEELIELHPLFLQWMLLAKERIDGAWHFRYSEPLRRWIARWLRARAAGSPKSSARAFSSKDWSLDPTPWREQKEKAL